MARKLILALASTAALLCAGSAHAGGVNWAIGISAPGIGTVISNAPVYQPAPVAYQQPRVVYRPPHVIYPEPQVVYLLPQVVFRPVPRVDAPGWVPPGHRRDGERDGRRWHRDERRYDY